MKVKDKPFLLFILLISLCCTIPEKIVAQPAFSFQLFYDDLSPYGEWVDNPDYGYVWIPDVHDGFAPYSTNGYWVFTDAGWTWLSNYRWGWAPFHYGRWYYDPYYGYAWIPGDEWGPGWVTWRWSEGYYGWAPIGPGISIDIAYGGTYNQPYNEWRFVRDRDFGRTNIYNYYIGQSNYPTFINNSVVINNMYEEHSANIRYNTGPERTEVQRRTGRTFRPVSVRNTEKPAQSLGANELKLYRPRVEKNNINNGVRNAPSKITNWNNGKPDTKKNTGAPQRITKQPGRVQPISADKTIPPVKQQPIKQQPVRKPSQTPHTEQPVKQPNRQPLQPSRREQPAKEQPVKQQPVREPAKPTRTQQPTRQQPEQRPVKPQRTTQPAQRVPAQQPVQPPPKQRKEKKVEASFNQYLVPATQWPTQTRDNFNHAKEPMVELPYVKPEPPHQNKRPENKKTS
jgi:hypothetical protein